MKQMDNYILSPIQIGKLKAELSDELLEKLLPHLQKIPHKIDDYLLSRKQAAEYLIISLVTLGEWTKLGIIQSYRIHSSIRYKREELQACLKKVRFTNV